MDPSSTPPKLSPYSLPVPRRQVLATATPPPRIPVSVPFQWEEAPGMPRERPAPSGPDRILILPPRMAAAATVAEIKSEKLLSPTTVLDGPEPNSIELASRQYIPFGRVSNRKVRGSWFRRRGVGRKVVMDSVGVEDKRVICSSVSSSRWRNDGDINAHDEIGNNVRITRLRRNTSDKPRKLCHYAHLGKHLRKPKASGAAAMEKGPQSLSPFMQCGALMEVQR